MEDKLTVFSSMAQAMKEVTAAIRESKPVDVHSNLYSSFMD